MNESEDVAKASTVKREEYNKATIYKGPNVASKPSDQLYIRAAKTDFGRVDYQIFAVINYRGTWRFYNWAYDADGNSLDLAVMTRNLDQCKSNDCAHNEDLVISVTKKYREGNMDSGLRFWVSAKKEGVKEEFYIPSGYIKAFLSLSGD